MNIDRPQMKTSASERLVTESYSKLASSKTGLFRVIKVTPETVTIDQDGIGNTALETGLQ